MNALGMNKLREIVGMKQSTYHYYASLVPEDGPMCTTRQHDTWKSLCSELEYFNIPYSWYDLEPQFDDQCGPCIQVEDGELFTFRSRA